MPYLDSIEPQTWRSMLEAADKRFGDAQRLYIEGEPNFAGAIYLYGYVIELTLKSAYFQADGFYGPGDEIGELCKRPQSLFDSLGNSVWEEQSHTLLGYSEKGHDLLAWFKALVRIRFDLPMDARFASEALNHTARVASVWGTFRRYDPRTATIAEAAPVHNSVEWLHRNRIQLWS